MSEISADFPQEIISEILVRLPVKSIGISRCVSKPWLSLLTSYEFIKAHLAAHNNTHSLAQKQKLLLHSDYGSFFSLILHPGGNRLRELQFFDYVHDLVGSCNGLVLVVTQRSNKCLINCLTREYVKLQPDSPFQPYANIICIYGFGYDTLSDDYKIVSISAPTHENGDAFVDIYTLKMKSWRRFGTSPYGYDYYNEASGVFLNGALYWVGWKSSYNESPVIVAFDLSCEGFREIPVPACIDESKFTSAKLMVIDGCLGIAVELYTNVLAEIWLMQSNKSWKRLVIDMEFTTWWELFCCHNEKLVFSDPDECLKWYHLEDGRVEVCLDKRDMRDLIHGITYTESLVSPHFNYHRNP